MNKNDLLKKIINLKKEIKEEGIVFNVDGTLKSAIFAFLASEVFKGKIKLLFISIDNEVKYKRNFLRIIEKLNVKNLSFNITDEFYLIINSIFEIKDPYSSLEVYEKYEKTGEIESDLSYLKNKNLNKMYKYTKSELINLLSNAHAIMEDYFLIKNNYINNLINLNKSDLINLANEIKIPKRIIETGV